MWTLLVALVLSLGLQPLMLMYLRRAQILDHPTTRSSHAQPTLRGGGLAVAVAILLCLALAVASDAVEAAAVLPASIAVLALAALGFVEDVRGVPAGRRFVCQLMGGGLTAGFAVSAGASLWVATATAVAVVVYANAFNFMDGLNGISGLNAAFSGLAYAAIATTFDVPGAIVAGLAVAGASLGFLPYNFPSARVFLGDSGSYALGGVLAVLAVQCWAGGAPVLLCAAPVAIYLADTGSTLLVRARRGDSLLSPHRDHVYQRAADSRLGRAGSAAGTAVVAAALTAVAYAAGGDSGMRYGAGVAFVAIVLGYLGAPALLPLAPSKDGSQTVARSRDLSTGRRAQTRVG